MNLLLLVSINTYLPKERFMIISGPYCPTSISSIGKLCLRRQAKPRYDCICDSCSKNFSERQDIFDARLNHIDMSVCGQCARLPNSSKAGLKAGYDENGNLKPNAGRFSSERVAKMSDSEYKLFCLQRKRASEIFQEILKNSPEKFKEHYDKVFKNSKIGYISAGQRQVYENLLLNDSSFLLEHTVEGIRCDIVHLEKKVVVEYYGDFWHLNPSKYNSDYYSNAIKMTAKEKWQKDRARNFVLRNKGYRVIIVWESAWKSDPQKYLRIILDAIDHKDESKSTISAPKQKYRWMYNANLSKRSLVRVELVDEKLKHGWRLGT
jgi:G:T-mismatch repair DNA endonuclease (very short patch repair protein)